MNTKPDAHTEIDADAEAQADADADLEADAMAYLLKEDGDIMSMLSSGGGTLMKMALPVLGVVGGIKALTEVGGMLGAGC